MKGHAASGEETSNGALLRCTKCSMYFRGFMWATDCARAGFDRHPWKVWGSHGIVPNTFRGLSGAFGVPYSFCCWMDESAGVAPECIPGFSDKKKSITVGIHRCCQTLRQRNLNGWMLGRFSETAHQRLPAQASSCALAASSRRLQRPWRSAHSRARPKLPPQAPCP